MATLIIEIRDSEKAMASDFIKNSGGNILEIDLEEDLTELEFTLLRESYKEALLIKDGVTKGTPAVELWND